MNTVKLVKNLEIDDLNTTRLGDTFKSEDIRITIIKRNGKVLYDNYKDKISEKHLQREEVKTSSRRRNRYMYPSFKYDATILFICGRL